MLQLHGVFNCHITATNQDGKIKFLYHIEEGAAGQNYGIEVAELAGVPDSVVNSLEISFIN